MLSRLHSKLGTAGLVVAIVALVAALTGAAFAAGGLTGQQEKQVKKIAKKFAGKPGAPGPAGPAGLPGTKGDKGDQGANGNDGADGKNVQVGNPTVGECPTGGATVQVEGESATKKKVCNGEAGGFSEEMESGTTLRGAWNIGHTNGESFPMTSVSYLMKYPSDTPPTMVLVRSAPRDCEALPEPGKSGCEAEKKAAEDNCHGTAAEPTADAGFLCFYQKLSNTQEYSVRGAPFTNSTPYGATMILLPNSSGGVFDALLMWGTWAVTAP